MATRKRWPWVVAVVGILVAIAFAVVVSWLLLNPNALSDERAEIAAVQAVAAIGFGVGGVGTLMLFVRRQWLQERAHELDRERVALDRQIAERQHKRELARAADDRHDATERRITELYMTAAEQLGHDKAPVRLAALHALDRLGQNEPDHRQVIADIWCSYLRQPFTPPARFTTASENGLDPEAGKAEHLTDPAPNPGADWAEVEYEVRATAQRLLINHLKDPRNKADRTDEPPPVEPDGFWDLLTIDLTDATLIRADFTNCWFPRAIFAYTRFHGAARFKRARFDGYARFWGARFNGYAMFDKARFNGTVLFGKAQFVEGFGFYGAVAVLNTDPWLGHMWPAGWRLEPSEDEPGWGRLVIQEESEQSPLAVHADDGRHPDGQSRIVPRWSACRSRISWTDS